MSRLDLGSGTYAGERVDLVKLAFLLKSERTSSLLWAGLT